MSRAFGQAAHSLLQRLAQLLATQSQDAALAALATAPEPLPIVLELKEQPAGTPTLDQVRAMFDKLEKTLEAKRPRATKS